jgi:hypothetical protein
MTRQLPIVNAERCTSCGGRCCKHMPGTSSPEDWGAPDEDAMAARIDGALRTGKWAIDWLDADEDVGSRVFYLRPAIKGKEGDVFDPSWGGTCTMLGPKGCALEYEQRPHGCRELVPGLPDAPCLRPDTTMPKITDAGLWAPYQDLLRDAGEIVTGRFA